MFAEFKKRLSAIKEAILKMPRRRRQIVLSLAIISFGVFCLILLKFTRQRPVRAEQESFAPLVKTQVVRMQDAQITVEGYGTVQPKVQAEVVAQVSGKVVKVHPDFKNGGFVKAGNALVTIDKRDYELAVQRAEAEVARAQVGLDIETAEAEVALREWQQLNPDGQSASELVLRQPQIHQAQRSLLAAEAGLETARLNLERAEISLPFDGRVISESVDIGQFINIGQSVGKVYGIEAMEIEVPLEDRELAWFYMPSNPVALNGMDSGRTGSEVEVIAEFAGSRHIWEGGVVRVAGEVDKMSRLISVVVEVPKPFDTAGGRPPLIPGMFVKLLIKGKVLEAAVAVPRFAIHNGNEVWVVRDERLNIRQVQIARQGQMVAYVVSGLEGGAEIVVSSLDKVVDGMRVRTESDGQGD